MYSRVILFFVIFSFCFGFFHTVHAQSSAGVELKPSTIERNAEPGQIIEEIFSLKNSSDSEQTYYLLSKDISGVKEDGVPIFADPGAEVTGFELSTWVTFQAEPIILSPKASVSIPIKISIPQDATPGSHFGGVFVSMEPPRLRESGASVGYEVGSLISIRIAGDALESARIREFSTQKVIHSSPDVTFSIRVENPGNVLVRPRGPLQIRNMLGKDVGLLTVNDSQAGVFPGTTRPFTVRWQEDGLAFGRYQATVGLLYGEKGGQTTVSATVSFWILPIKIIVPALGVLSLVLLLAYMGVRLYIRRALDEASSTQGRRVIVRRRKDTHISRFMVVFVTLLITTTVFLIGLLLLFA